MQNKLLNVWLVFQLVCHSLANCLSDTCPSVCSFFKSFWCWFRTRPSLGLVKDFGEEKHQARRRPNPPCSLRLRRPNIRHTAQTLIAPAGVNDKAARPERNGTFVCVSVCQNIKANRAPSNPQMRSRSSSTEMYP